MAPDFELKPAKLEENSVHLFYEPDGHREKNLDKHLDRAGTKAIPESHPKFTLKYLQDRPQDDEDVEEVAEDDFSTFEEDYQIKFAREFLSADGHRSRQKMIERSGPFLQSRQSTEEKRIIERMKALGIDWSEGPKDAGIAKIDVDLTLAKGGTKGRIEAGSEVELVATVTNTGAGPVHRLRGLIESEHPAFKGREFLFGRLDPGQTRKWSITTKIPKEAASRSDVLTLTLASSSGDVAGEAVLPVVTKYVPHPQFAYTYGYDDEKRGDGDGVLEVGEGVDFLIFVTNTGPGDADDVSLRLKSAANEQLFLERGRASIGPIKSGETRMGRLRFRIPSSSHIANQDLALELTIYDSGTGEWLEDQFAVVAKAAHYNKLVKKTGLGTIARDAVVYAIPGSDILASAKKGTKLSVDGKNGEFYRVGLVDEATGWVKASDLKLKSGQQKTPALVSYRPKRRPPTIELSNDLGGSVVDSETVELSGKIAGRSLRDMYVLVNDKKVFFKSGPEAQPGTADPTGIAEPNDHSVELPFKLDLRLDEGLNKVLVVARLDEKVISYRSLFVSRRASPHPAVATTDTPAKTAKQSP